MKIFILHTFNADTAPKFSVHLKRCETGNRLPENSSEYFIINYGINYSHARLNKHLVTNKLEALRILREAGVLVPRFDFLPINRISIMDLLNWVRRMTFPLLARKIKHWKGKDIIFLRSRFSLRRRLRRVLNRQFLVQYIPKQAEFRVHVLGNEAPIVCQKVPSEHSETHHPHVWTSDRGWTLINYNGDNREALQSLGIKAIKALKYDFGAVDIGLGKDGQFYVFEVNSAPRLSKTRRRIYASL